jgi:ADP-dependent phosphofructokinase/glucokinase
MQTMKVICGYNVNIDAVHNISGDEISRLIIGHDIQPRPKLPEEISSLEDLLSGLLLCMKNGSGAELLITDPKTADLIGRSFGWEYRLGGNAGNMANVLAGLGAEPLLNIPAPTNRQVSFLHPRVMLAEKGSLRQANIAGRDGKDMTHFVFQFSAGEKTKTAEETIISPVENRFIASFDVLNRNIHTDPSFDRYCVEHLDEMDGALVAGFHLVPYHSHEEVIKKRIGQIRSWKEIRPELFIHAEMGSFQRHEIMGYLLEHLASDSIGMNEDELAMLMSFEPGWRGIIDAARRVRSRFGIPRVCVHTREYVVSAVGTARCLIGPEEEISAIERGTEVAATLAACGRITGEDSVTKERLALGVSAVGASAVDDLCTMGAERFGRGAYVRFGDEFCCLVPSLNVSRPLVVVGLGDSMTAATFFYELALR